MKNRVIVSAAKFLAFCMVFCTCVLFVVLRTGFYDSPFLLFSFPQTMSGPMWFEVLVSAPSIPIAIVVSFVCLYGMWREAKCMQSSDE